MRYTDRRASARQAPATIRVGREYTRVPDPAWQEALDRIAPPADTVSSLRILWEAGDPWEPLERWVIWQVYPLHRDGAPVFPGLLGSTPFLGPAPRATGHYCGAGWCNCALKANRWVDGSPSAFGIDQRMWELFHATGRVHRRFWVVQGDDGGHPFRYTKWEQKYRRMQGMPGDAPSIGDLPYAEPDLRTWGRIGGLNLLRAHREMKDFTARTVEDHARADRDADEAQEARKLAWIEDRLTDAAPRLSKALRRAGFGGRETRNAFDADATKAQQLTEGDFRPVGV